MSLRPRFSSSCQLNGVLNGYVSICSNSLITLTRWYEELGMSTCVIAYVPPSFWSGLPAGHDTALATRIEINGTLMHTSRIPHNRCPLWLLIGGSPISTANFKVLICDSRLRSTTQFSFSIELGDSISYNELKNSCELPSQSPIVLVQRENLRSVMMLNVERGNGAT